MSPAVLPESVGPTFRSLCQPCGSNPKHSLCNMPRSSVMFFRSRRKRRRPPVSRTGRAYVRPRLESLEGRRVPAGGALDPTFGTAGRVLFEYQFTDVVNDIAREADGKYLVGGGSSALGPSDFALARFNPDGTLDTTFGQGGK